MNKKPNAQKRRPSRHKKRMRLVQIGLVGALAVVVSRIGFVQQAFGPGLLASAAKVQDTSKVLMAERGAILDRSGHTLAYDVPAYMMDIRTSSFQDLTATANALAPALGTSSGNVLATLERSKSWVRWQTPLLATDKDAVVKAIQGLATTDKTSPLQDVTFTPTEERYYPFGQFASNTLGFVDRASGQGVTGLEAQYNKQLSGTNGKIDYTQDRYGFPIQSTVHTVTPAVSGDNLQTTIDETIQGFVEQEMNSLIAQYNPEHAAIIVTDPSNGDILAMSSRPTFDPNQYWNASSEALNTNWAVDASFEPGSTFKPFTMAAGLATHSISLDQTFTSGHTTIAGQTIYDWNRVGWGGPSHVISFRQALEYSSNVGFAKAALRVGWPNMLHYMQIFGFLNPTGVDLPGEATSQIFPEADRHTIELATSGFGQGISVTPMQQIAAYGAIANGGKLIQPHLASALVNPGNGKVVKTFAPVVENPQVVPRDVIAQINNTLVLDITKGIDQIAAIPGYQVAGKTGTANTVDPKTGKYYANRFIVSFMGYAPASNPKFEIYVTLDWPKTSLGNQWGSTIAAPAATQILKECLQYEHVPPDDPSSLPAASAKLVKVSSPNSMVSLPSVVGQGVKQATASLAAKGLNGIVVGNGSVVTNMWPKSPGMLGKGSNVWLLAQNSKSRTVKMPDLTGASLRDAMDLLNSLSINVDLTGAGFVQAQSIPPGKLVTPGTTVKITCAMPSIAMPELNPTTGNGASSNSTSPNGAGNNSTLGTSSSSGNSAG